MGALIFLVIGVIVFFYFWDILLGVRNKPSWMRFDGSPNTNDAQQSHKQTSSFMDWKEELLEKKRQEQIMAERGKPSAGICERKLDDFWNEIIKQNNKLHEKIRLKQSKGNDADIMLFPQVANARCLKKRDLSISYGYDDGEGDQAFIKFNGTDYYLEYYNTIGCYQGHNNFGHKLKFADIDTILRNVCMQKNLETDLESDDDLDLIVRGGKRGNSSACINRYGSSMLRMGSCIKLVEHIAY